MFLGNVGGGGGVNYRLAAINAKRKDELKIINVFSDVCVERETFNLIKLSQLPDSSKTLKGKLKKLMYTTPLLLPYMFNNKINNAEYYLKKTDSKYCFCEDDVFYFHDLESAIAFRKLYSFTKTILVYHHQGSIYYEWSSDTGIKSERLREWLNEYQKKAFDSVHFWGFPSKGARNSLIESEPELKNFIEAKDFIVLYNGMDCKISSESITENVHDTLEKLDEYSGLKIITVSTLNEAKGVDRIPVFLEDLKKNNVNFKWILVGQGIKEAEIDETLDLLKIRDDVIWFHDRVPHDDILRLLGACDFYLMLHKVSIFDFATVEAMSCGCIPVLSSVGGNKEVVFGDNGLLLSNISNSKEFLEYLSRISVSDEKIENKKLQNQYFSEERFFANYIEFAEKIGRNTK